MKDLELYLQTKQAQLSEYEAKLEELKEKLSKTDANASAELDKQINTIELKLRDGKIKLEAVKKATKEDIDEIFRTIYTHLAMS
jgi:uncharacterized protein YicC (UPF0701 family)